MKARAVKSFPIGKEWMYEPKWDGFRCLIFRDEENIFLQSRTGKSLTSGFPEIVAAFETLSPKRFVLDGELALPTEDGFSFDGLVNRLRIGSARLALEVRDSPAIYQGSIVGFKIMYRDSERIWDGINWDGKRASFFALREIELLCRPKPAF